MNMTSTVAFISDPPTTISANPSAVAGLRLTQALLYSTLLLGALHWLPFIPYHYLKITKDALLFGFLALSLFHQAEDCSMVKNITILDLAFILFVVAAFVGVLSSPAVVQSGFIWLRYLVGFLLYRSIKHLLLTNPHFGDKLVLFLLPPILLSIGYVFASELTGIRISPPDAFTRAYGLPGYLMGFSYRTGGLAWSIALVIPFINYRYCVNQNKIGKALWALIFFAALAVLVMTRSRVALIGGLIAVILPAAIFWQQQHRQILAWICIFAVTIVVTGGFWNTREYVHETIFRLANERTQSHHTSDEFIHIASSGRVALIEEGWQTFLANPWTGIGLGGFYDHARGEGIGWHNWFIRLAAGAGIAGFITSIFLAFRMLAMTVQLIFIKDNPMALALVQIILVGMASLIVEGGVVFNVHMGLPFFAALAFADIMVERREKKVPIPSPLADRFH